MSERHDGYVTGPIHMVRTEHSKEPWEAHFGGAHDDTEIVDATGLHVTKIARAGDADARRIIACVNILAGTPTETLERVLEAGVRLTVFDDKRGGINCDLTDVAP